MTEKKIVVALCMPVGEKVDPQTLTSLMMLDKNGLVFHTMMLSGFQVDVARNMITKEVIDNADKARAGQLSPEHDVDYLFWVDSDMVFSAPSLKRLLKHALSEPRPSIVGGLCFSRQHPYKPVIARFYDPSWGYEPGAIGWMWDYPRESLIEVDRTGGAFLVIHTDVFRKIREQECQKKVEGWAGAHKAEYDQAVAAYKDWWMPLADECHAEDLSFCKRAQAAGYKIMVDTGSEIGHMGEVVVGPEFSARNRQFEYHRWLPSLDVLLDACATRPADKSPVPLAPATAASPLDLTKPVVSVVIPTYNTEPKYLVAAVKSALAQTVPTEVIVVDDGSDKPVVLDISPSADRSVMVIRHEKNLGIAAALNTGISAMSTEWFAWLSADDMFEPEKLEMQLAALAFTRLKCCYTSYDIRCDRHRAVKHPRFVAWNTMEEQHAYLSRGCSINGSTVLIHKSVLDEAGPFDVSYKYGQDWEMWARIGRTHLWHGIPDKLTVRREFDNLTTAIEMANADDPRRLQRDLEDMRIRRQYASRQCPHCGGVLA